MTIFKFDFILKFPFSQVISLRASPLSRTHSKHFTANYYYNNRFVELTRELSDAKQLHLVEKKPQTPTLSLSLSSCSTLKIDVHHRTIYSKL